MFITFDPERYDTNVKVISTIDTRTSFGLSCWVVISGCTKHFSRDRGSSSPPSSHLLQLSLPASLHVCYLWLSSISSSPSVFLTTFQGVRGGIDRDTGAENMEGLILVLSPLLLVPPSPLLPSSSSLCCFLIFYLSRKPPSSEHRIPRENIQYHSKEVTAYLKRPEELLLRNLYVLFTSLLYFSFVLLLIFYFFLLFSNTID